MRDPSRRINTRALIVAVFGIPGVGKTSTIWRTLQKYPQCISLSVSRLIAESTATKNPTDNLRTKLKNQILESQNIAIQGIKKVSQTYPRKLILVDAHSVIDNDQELIRIPIRVVESFEPSILVFIYDEPAQIRTRRQGDKKRMRADRTVDQITAEQSTALDTCREYSLSLQIRLCEIKAGDTISLGQVIEQQLQTFKMKLSH